MPATFLPASANRITLAHWGLLFFALSWFSDDTFNLSLLLLSINAVIHKKVWMPRSRSRASHWCFTLLSGMTLLYLVGQAIALNTSHWFAYFDWATLLFAPLIGVALHQCRRQLPWFLLLIPIAVFLRMLKNIDWMDLHSTLFSAIPYGFGRHHVPFGLYCAFSLLILMAVSPGLISGFSSRWKRFPLAVLISVVTIALLQGLMTSQSRLAWLVTLGGTSLFLLIRLRRATAYTPDRKLLLWGVTSASVLIVGMIALNYDKLQDRLIKQSTVNFELSLDVSKLPRDEDVFIARRLHLSAFGLEAWDQKPYFGWGPGNVRPLLAQDPDFNQHRHLHNSYVQTLAELGLMGFGLFTILYVSLVLSASHSWRTFGEHVFLGPLVVAMALSYFGWCLFDVRLHNIDGRFVILLLSGLVYSQALDAWHVQATRRRGS